MLRFVKGTCQFSRACIQILIYFAPNGLFSLTSCTYHLLDPVHTFHLPSSCLINFLPSCSNLMSQFIKIEISLLDYATIRRSAAYILWKITKIYQTELRKLKLENILYFYCQFPKIKFSVQLKDLEQPRLLDSSFLCYYNFYFMVLNIVFFFLYFFFKKEYKWQNYEWVCFIKKLSRELFFFLDSIIASFF